MELLSLLELLSLCINTLVWEREEIENTFESICWRLSYIDMYFAGILIYKRVIYSNKV